MLSSSSVLYSLLKRVLHMLYDDNLAVVTFLFPAMASTVLLVEEPQALVSVVWFILFVQRLRLLLVYRFSRLVFLIPILHELLL